MMTPDISSWVTVGVLGIAFAAGGYAAATRKTMRDVNGLGHKYGRIVALLMLWADTEERRQQVADLLIGKTPQQKK